MHRDWWTFLDSSYWSALNTPLREAISSLPLRKHILWEEVLFDFMPFQQLLSTHRPVLNLHHFVLGVYFLFRLLYHSLPWFFRQAYGLLSPLRTLIILLSPQPHLFLHLLNAFPTEKLNVVPLMLCIEEVKNEPLENHLSRFTNNLVLRGLGTDYLTFNGYVILWR